MEKGLPKKNGRYRRGRGVTLNRAKRAPVLVDRGGCGKGGVEGCEKEKSQKRKRIWAWRPGGGAAAECGGKRSRNEKSNWQEISNVQFKGLYTKVYIISYLWTDNVVVRICTNLIYFLRKYVPTPKGCYHHVRDSCGSLFYPPPQPPSALRKGNPKGRGSFREWKFPKM